MEEKVQTFIGLTLTGAAYREGTVVLTFDVDGDPDTSETTTLSIFNVSDEDIRKD